MNNFDDENMIRLVSSAYKSPSFIEQNNEDEDKNDSNLGHIEHHWGKFEYQKRGAVHDHMVFWIKPGTIPANDVMAEIPRYKDMNNPIVKKLVMDTKGRKLKTECVSFVFKNI
jgi:hypothetical protein